jgi:hypothetical protein
MARPEITGRKSGATDSTTIFDLTGDELVPDAKVARLFGVCSKTITRWDQDPKLEFPDAIWINNRKYRRGKGLKQFVQRRIKAGKGGAARARTSPPCSRASS